MDISKFKIPTLDGLNWGLWFIHIQLTSRILDIWDAMRGEVIAAIGTMPQSFNLLAKPTPVAANATATKVAAYTSEKAIWSKKNVQGLGLIQAPMLGVVWQDYQTLSTTKEVLDTLETAFRAAGGALTYLQLVNMVKFSSPIQQICCHKSNYFRITTTESHRMATAGSLKTLPPSCFARVFQTHTN